MEKVFDISVVIPAFNPDSKMLSLLAELVGRFSHVIVVDDGSETGKELFPEAERMGCVVLRHPQNRGKGAALKTAFAWILANLPECKSVVTADADGQHRIEDIERVASVSAENPSTLTLGVRAFSGKVPLRSRFGNWWTRLFFFMATGLWLRDTQTGLRGIPASLLPRMIELQGARYEYEMRMLVDSKGYAPPPVQVPIDTVYIEDNASSHFRPILDTIKIYGALLHFGLSSFMSFLLDNAAFTVVLYLTTALTHWRRATCVLVSLCLARAVSASFNYFYNRSCVFKVKDDISRSMPRYWILVLVIAACSYGLTAGLARIADAQGVAITCIKIVCETFLFFLSYGIQKKWIFK